MSRKKKKKMAGGKKIVDTAPQSEKSRIKGTAKKATPVKKAVSKSATSDEGAPDLKAQRLVALFGFGICGLLVGALTGANHLPPMPEALAGTGVEAASWTAYSVGRQLYDVGLGIQGGVLGAVVGSTLGFSVLLNPGVMLASWGLSSAFLGAALKFGGSLWLATLGWMAGFAPFLFRELASGKN